jgi:hypothetical protein
MTEESRSRVRRREEERREKQKCRREQVTSPHNSNPIRLLIFFSFLPHFTISSSPSYPSTFKL